MIPPHILEDINLLKGKFEVIEVHDDNPIIVVVNNFLLPAGYNKSSTKLLIKIPISYPNCMLDMFWVDLDARPSNKPLPFSEVNEDILGLKWLRYSWHPKKWTPGSDNVLTFIEFIIVGLDKATK
jgi:hypothetical protein